MFAIQHFDQTQFDKTHFDQTHFGNEPGTVREPDWQELALCNDGTGSMTELFFSEQLDDIAAAKAFCQECPVKETCLDGAMARREPWGVWGGELFVHGKIVAQKRKRGRPPKVRPEVDAEQAQSA